MRIARVIAISILGVLQLSAIQSQGVPAAASVRGRVLAEGSGEPVPNARIAIAGTPDAARSGVDGRFAINMARPSTIVVTKAGFVGVEQILDTARARAAGELEIRLTRAAVLAGHVIDESGDPVVDAIVRIAGARTGGTMAAGPARTLTDDRGAYRIGGLSPDAYLVSVMTRGGGQVSLQQQDPSVTTFFPGTSEQQDATPVTLHAGEERDNIDFHLDALQTARQGKSVYPTIVSFRDLNIPFSGDASIRGTVINPDGHALPLALVVLYGEGAQSSFTYRVSSADDAGRYAFTDLPPGDYRVEASKAGYSLPSDGYTLENFARAGTRTTIAAAQSRDRVDVTLLPWATITGHVLDETGEPVAGARVGLLLSRFQGGRRRLVPARITQRETDDRGEFRLYALPEGQYVVGATVADTPARDIGGYGPTYFPGTGSTAEARFVRVTTGGNVAGIDFNLVPAPTARITGTLVNAAGQPTTGGRFNLLPRSALTARIDATIGRDGKFEFRNVPPGQYVIQADRGRLGGNTEGEFGAFPVIVTNGADVSGMTLRTSLGTTITGRVLYESTTGEMPSPAATSLSAVPADFDLAPPSLAVAEPDADGAFQLRGITGLRRLQATKVPKGWMLTSIVMNGHDVTDELLDFGQPNQGEVSVDVVLSTRVNELAGRVLDERGRGVVDARVVAFSTDRDRWYPASRFVKSVQTTGDGSYSVSGLPTGSYFVTAVTRTPAGDDAWSDPQWLDSIRPGATSVALGEGQRQTVTVRVSSR